MSKSKRVSNTGQNNFNRSRWDLYRLKSAIAGGVFGALGTGLLYRLTTNGIDSEWWLIFIIWLLVGVLLAGIIKR